MSRLMLSLLVVAACCGEALEAQVLVVDAKGGPGRYLTVQTAVDDAKDGDTILIQVEHREPGSGMVRLVGKSLHFVGLGATWFTQPWFDVTITNHPSGSTTTFGPVTSKVVIAGGGGTIVFDSAWSGFISFNQQSAVHISDFSGTVCFSRSVLDSGALGSMPTLYVANTRLVLLADSLLRRAGGTALSAAPGYPCVIASRSRIELVNTRVQGGFGYCRGGLFPHECGDGGPGMVVTECGVRLTGNSEVIGGSSGPSGQSLGVGGDGIRMVASSLEHEPNQVKGGSGGGGAGRAIVRDTASQVLVRLFIAPSVERVDTLLRFGRQATWAVRGEPGFPVVTLVARRLQPTVLPFGTLHIDLQSLLFPVASVLDGQGRASLQIVFDRLDPFLIGTTYALQPVSVDRKAVLVLGAANTSVLVL